MEYFSPFHFTFLYYLSTWRLIEETPFGGSKEQDCFIHSEMKRNQKDQSQTMVKWLHSTKQKKERILACTCYGATVFFSVTEEDKLMQIMNNYKVFKDSSF